MTPAVQAQAARARTTAPLDICVVICLILVAVAVLGCVFSRIANTRSISADSVAIIIAFAFAISQSSAMLVSSLNGLATGGSGDSKVEKAFYASSILNTATIVTSKAAMALFMRALIPPQTQRRLGLAFLGLLGAWAAGSAIAAALQCDAAHPWRSNAGGVCINKAFWVSFGAISIATDLVLVAWALRIISKLQMAWYRKLLIATCFASRLLAIAATATQIAIQEQLDAFANQDSDVFKVAVCMQVTQSLSVITACSPYLVTFFGSMVSGMLRADDIRRQYGSSIDSRMPRANKSHSMLQLPRNILRSYANPSAVSQLQAIPPGPLQALRPRQHLANSSLELEHMNPVQDNVILRATEIQVVAEPSTRQGSTQQAVVPWEAFEQNDTASTAR